MNMANISTGILSNHELENFGRLVKNVGEILQDQETLKLFTLALLFSDEAKWEKRGFFFFGKNSKTASICYM